MLTTVSRRVSFAASLVLSALALQPAGAQSAAGKWEGNVYAQGMTIPIVITLDSTSSGWTGTFLAAQLHPEAIPIAVVTVKKDTVSMQLPEEGMSAFFQGLIAADRKTMNGNVAVQGDNSVTFQVTKSAAPAKPSPAAGR